MARRTPHMVAKALRLGPLAQAGASPRTAIKATLVALVATAVATTAMAAAVARPARLATERMEGTCAPPRITPALAVVVVHGSTLVVAAVAVAATAAHRLVRVAAVRVALEARALMAQAKKVVRQAARPRVLVVRAGASGTSATRAGMVG